MWSRSSSRSAWRRLHRTQARSSVGAGVAIGGWATLIFGFVFCGSSDLLRRCSLSRSRGHDERSAARLHRDPGLFVWLGLIPSIGSGKFSPLSWRSPCGRLVYSVGWGALGGCAGWAQFVQIVPSVVGEVLEVRSLRIHRSGKAMCCSVSTRHLSAQVEAIEVQLKFAELRLSQYTQLHAPIPAVLRRAAARIGSRPAQGAARQPRWNLDKTTVRRRADAMSPTWRCARERV